MANGAAFSRPEPPFDAIKEKKSCKQNMQVAAARMARSGEQNRA